MSWDIAKQILPLAYMSVITVKCNSVVHTERQNNFRIYIVIPPPPHNITLAILIAIEKKTFAHKICVIVLLKFVLR